MSPPRPSTNPAHRIAKLLARAGIASRREIERMIAEGRVALDGKPLETPATVLPSLRGVTVDGKPVAQAEPARLFVYHKPVGLLVTERDPKGRPTIYDRLPKGLPRLVPVGRLDLNTEGLLLLTTDGELKRQLELPATGVERTYRARTYGNVSQAQLEELIEGIEIEGVRYGSIDANLERRTGANTWIELTLKEGKNREVRRVLEHLGLKVSRLIRTRYGPFVLADMPAGEVGEIRQHDVVAFRKNPTRADVAVVAQQAKPIAAPKPEEDRTAKPRGATAPGQATRPVRGKPAKPARRPAADGIAKPARAARAKAFRDERAPAPRPEGASRGAAPGNPRSPRAAQRPDSGNPAAKRRGGGGAATPSPPRPDNKPQRPRRPGPSSGRPPSPSGGGPRKR